MSGSARFALARAKSGRMGVVVLLVFLGLVFLAINAANGLPGSEHQDQKVSFNDVGALRAGDDVRVAGIRVGKVNDIRLEDGKAVVTLSFDGHRKLYRDAKAVISQRSALGQAYVNVTPGTPAKGALGADAVLSSDEHADGQDLANVLNVLDERTRKALRSSVLELGNGSRGHSADLNAALRALPGALPDLARVSSALTSNDGQDVTELLHATNALATSFNGQRQALAALTGQLDTTLASLATDGGTPLSQTLQQAPAALASVRQGLDSLAQPLADTRQAVTALRPGATALGKATPDLRAFLRDSRTPLDKVPGVAKQAVGPIGDLTKTFSDARPLAPRLAKAVVDASQPLSVLAPYSPEIQLFFTYLADALHEGDAAGHWLRFYPVTGSEAISGVVPVPDPLVARDAYPAPGVSANERKTSLLGTRD